MNGGLASPAARRTVAPEAAPPSRPAPAKPPPVRELPGPRAVEEEAVAMPTTRDRLEASFGAEAPAAEAPAEPVTTRERIVNRARTAEGEVPLAEPAVTAAPVIDLVEERERRRPPAAEPSVRGVGPAEVIPLVPRTGPPARAPPPREAEPAEVPEPAEVVAGEARARAPPAPEAVPEAEPGAPEAEPAAPEAEPAAPEAEPGAPEGEPAPEPAVAEPVPPPAAPGPEDDPAFQAMKARATRSAGRAKHHQPSEEGAATAQAASEPDVEKDKASQAAGDQVGVMGDKKPGEFDPVAFKAAVAEAVKGMAPPATLEEADEFEESGKAAGATEAIHGIVSTGKSNSERDIKVATETPPDPSGKQPKQVVTPMANDVPGPPLPNVNAEAALPGLRPESEVDLSDGPLAIERKLAEANVTEAQLAEGNEPAFNDALGATQEVRDHAATAPAGYREQEAVVLEAGRAEAGPAAAAQLQGMRGSRVGALEAVLGTKDATKVADKTLRDEINQKLLDIHAQTQSDVQKILEQLDRAVESIFTTGESAARKKFEEDVDRDMREYKRRRYRGARGKLRWLKDRFFDLPSEVNRFYREGRDNYLKAMDKVIDSIALTVGQQLGAAHARILAGRVEVETYVAKLPDSVRELGKTTAADLDHKFDDLAADVDAKRDELVDTVARLYVDSRDQLDERIKELKEANKGLVSRAIDAVIGVLKTIYELGKLLLRVLLKAASAIGDILAHPIRFLGNLVGAVKGGLERFVGRIWHHLEKAMTDLLFGELGSAGITMPKQLDFAGILDLVLQVLGLTYDRIRARLVDRFGEEAVAQMERTVDVFKTIVSEGLGGLWTWIRDKLGDLEDLVIGKIKSYIVDRVIKAGISYVVALLNPAAAFIKACQGIYQIVMFVVERARQIATFVESILDSIAAIAQGNTGAAIERIDNALGNALSLAIAFLGRLANLGGLSEKMRSIIAAIRRPVTRVVDLVIFGAANVYRRTVGRAVAFGREKVEAGREWAKGKVDAGREWARKRAEGAPLRVATKDLPREPPAEAERADGDVSHPVRIAESRVDVAPDEQHVVFALLSPGGNIDLGVNSSTQAIVAYVRHFEPRIDSLPEVPPARLPKGGKRGDQPRWQARQAATRILEDSPLLEVALEQERAKRAAHPAAGPGRQVVSVDAPPPALKKRLEKLGDRLQGLMRLFYAYDRPKFERVEDEPARGQKLTGRVWALPIEGRKGRVLPEGGTRGLHPTRAGSGDYEFLASDPDLAPPERGAVIAGGRARGIVYLKREKGVGQPNVVVRSWAVGGTPDTGSNASHTETHFYHWFEAQKEEFWARVTAIELRSVLSPCGGCTELLEGIARMAKTRPAGAPKPLLILWWDQVYRNKEGKREKPAATFLRHIDQLVSAGWTVHGPRPPD